MTLKDQMAADLAADGCFANLDDFAEEITFYPDGGGTPVPLTVCPWSIDSERKHDQGTVDANLELWGCTIPCAALSRRPQRGDSIHRESDTDANARWDFESILDADSAGWVTRFQRLKGQRIGKLRPAST